MRLSRFIVLLGGVAFIFGCSQQQRSVPQNTIGAITITKAITIPKGTARVSFQKGAVQASPNSFGLYCEIEVHSLSNGRDQIKPGTFSIYRHYRQRTRDELSGFPLPPEACPNPTFFERHFRLRSRAEPNVRKLICRERFSGCHGRYPSKSGIARTLGSGVTLKFIR